MQAGGNEHTSVRVGAKPTRRRAMAVMLITFGLAVACAVFSWPTSPRMASGSATPSVTLYITQTASATYEPAPVTPTPAASATLFPDPDLPAWQHFLPPRLAPVTAVPLPMDGINLPAEVRAMTLLGTDREAPFVGRTDAMLLVFYHPRLARASFLSVPPDLFMYMPGYTMQRANIAYAVGGFDQVASMFEYNLGVRPQNYALVHTDDFSRYIDSLGGIDVNIYQDYSPACSGALAGTWRLNGEQLLCYVRLRSGMDEPDRNLRQQQSLDLILRRMVQGGNLLRLPELIATYGGRLEHNFLVEDLLGAVPLALRLGDPNRLGFFSFKEEQTEVWNMPQDAEAAVFLPRREAVRQVVQDAIDFVLTPMPPSDVFITLQYEMTVSSTATSTPTPTLTSTGTITPTVTETRKNTRTITLTPTISKTPKPDIVYSMDISRDRFYDLMALDIDSHFLYPIYKSVTQVDVNTPTPAPGSMSVMMGDWSPDYVRMLIYIDGQMYSIYPNGSNKTLLSGQHFITSRDYNTQPSFSRDGKRIAFVKGTGNDSEIYVMNISGTTLSGALRLTNDGYADSQPDWSPDGNSIVYISDHGGNPDIYRLKVSILLQPTPTRTRTITRTPYTETPTRTPTRTPPTETPTPTPTFTTTPTATSPVIVPEQLTNTTERELFPHYSPNGSQLLFSRLIGDQWDAYVGDPTNMGTLTFATSLTLKLDTAVGDDQLYANWMGPNMIVFSSNHAGNSDDPKASQYDIYIMKLDGKGLRRLTSDVRREVNIYWRPKYAP